MSHKVAIIGSGPSGLTAGIYTSRANLETTIFTGMQPGGQLTTTTEVENFPGFPEGIMGPDLMEKMQKQAERFGSKVKMTAVEKIEVNKKDNGKPEFLVKFMGGEETFDAVIVASGASAKYLGIEGEEKWVGKGYHSCATCDGFFYKDKVIAVVGGGDSAMEESNFLTKFASKVYLIHRRDEFKASKIMVERAKNNPKIEFLVNSGITEFHGEEKISSVTIENFKTGEKSELKLDGVFVAIGHKPNTDFIKDVLDVDESGYLEADKGTMSEVEGIFVSGDVRDKVYRQAVTSAGEGCKAAIDCERWLES